MIHHANLDSVVCAALLKTSVFMLIQDRMYAKCLIDDLHDIYSLFGPDCVTFLSNDDKARIALGLPAAKVQAPILMRMEYKVGGVNQTSVCFRLA